MKHKPRRAEGETAEEAARKVVRMADRLRRWTEMACRSWGLYNGTNSAIGSIKDQAPLAASMADAAREHAALMTVLRVSALLDADPGTISFQAVHHRLKIEGAAEAIAGIFAQTPPASSIEKARPACAASIGRFEAAYGTIKWPVCGKLQHFRNHDLAHLSWVEATRSVTYGEIDALISILMKLSTEVCFMTSGLNEDADEDREAAQADGLEFWRAALGREPLR